MAESINCIISNEPKAFVLQQLLLRDYCVENPLILAQAGELSSSTLHVLPSFNKQTLSLDIAVGRSVGFSQPP